MSGKVNKVSYQPGKGDQFFHQYLYDAENRITDVYTSRDELIWQQDAFYRYYLHGPLARTEIGQRKVQGLDYAYTLQGWIKGVNGVSNDAASDIGRDNYQVLTEFNHSTVSKDVFSYELDYFNSDYRAIGTTDQQFKYPFNNYATETSAVSRQLFNGNIIGMSTSLSQFGLAHYRYRYDQLNRLKEKHSYKTGDYGLEETNDYSEYFQYDANGNILNAERIAGQQSPLDVLTYQYENNSNKLSRVTDLVPPSDYDYDVDGQPFQNYTYDKIGNLVADKQESITNINWSVYGKIRGIIKRNAATGKETSTQYGYDPSGNRTYKEVIRRDIGNYSQDIVDRTYYVRDAQGNTMATYTRHEESGNTPSLKWAEQHLYGSSRIGVVNLNLDIPAQTTVPQVNQTLVDSLYTGEVVYELTNHLGNVMATISDKKLFSNIVIPETGAAAFYYPEVLSQTDYYAFGQEIKERAYRISGGYRYGFNGKENDSEVKGEGNQQDYGFRIFDPRLGRFLSVDPLYREYSMLSTYQFAGNRPIVAIDLEGLEPQEHPYSLKATGKPQLGVTKEGKIYEAYQVNSPTYGNGKQWVARIKEEISDQNGMAMKPIDHYLYFNNEASEWQNWQRGDEPSIRHKQTTELANGIGVGFFGAAVIGTGLPVLGEFAPLAQSYFSTAINAQMSTRIASTSSDVIMQYISNFPEYGFGRNNFERINLSSVALNFAAPGSNLIPAVGGSGLEFNLANGYQGLGSGNKSLGNFLLQSTIGIGGNYMGNKLEGVFSKYTNAGSFLNTFTGETLGNGTANNVQFIFNQMNKNDETPK